MSPTSFQLLYSAILNYTVPVRLEPTPCCGARHLPASTALLGICRPRPLAQVASSATGGAPIAPLRVMSPTSFQLLYSAMFEALLSAKVLYHNRWVFVKHKNIGWIRQIVYRERIATASFRAGCSMGKQQTDRGQRSRRDKQIEPVGVHRYGKVRFVQ